LDPVPRPLVIAAATAKEDHDMATTRKSGATSARGGSRGGGSRSTGSTRTRASSGGNSRSSRGNTDTPERDSRGRFKAEHHVRNAAVGGAVVVGAVAAGVAAAFKFGLLDRLLPAGEGHGAEDLLLDEDDVHGNDARTPTGRKRSSPDFRPDIDAPMTKAEREALRPPKGQRAVELAGADNGSVEEA
jgi:hypothetical protein